MGIRETKPLLKKGLDPQNFWDKIDSTETLRFMIAFWSADSKQNNHYIS